MLAFGLGARRFFDGKPLLALPKLLIAFQQLALPLIQRRELPIEPLFLLKKTFVSSCKLDELRLLLFLQLRLRLKQEIFGFKLGLFQDVLGLALGIVHDLLGLRFHLSPFRPSHVAAHQFENSDTRESSGNSAQNVENNCGRQRESPPSWHTRHTNQPGLRVGRTQIKRGASNGQGPRGNNAQERLLTVQSRNARDRLPASTTPVRFLSPCRLLDRRIACRDPSRRRGSAEEIGTIC